MDITAVICEYNPFHKGHKYQLDEIKRLYPDTTLLCVMSPNFVQRGGPSVIDKYARGECAALCGADAVISMPVVFSLLSAEGFAECGVKLAKALGATALSFGVETDSPEVLNRIAQLLLTEEFDQALSQEIKKTPDESFPAVREKALLRFLSKDEVSVIKGSNNILAVEYIKAIIKHCPDMNIRPIKRVGNQHLDTSLEGEFLSASAIRASFRQGNPIQPHIPDETHGVTESTPTLDSDKYETFLYSAITTAPYEKIYNACRSKELADIIFAAAKKFGDYKNFRSSLSRRKHPETKIDRVLTNVLLGLSFDEFLREEPSYATLLAMNDIGRKIISKRNSDEGPILLSRGAQYKKFTSDENFKRQIDFELFADRIYSRCLRTPRGEEYFMNKKPFIKE